MGLGDPGDGRHKPRGSLTSTLGAALQKPFLGQGPPEIAQGEISAAFFSCTREPFPMEIPQTNTSSILLTNSAMAGMLYYLSSHRDLHLLSQLHNNSWSLQDIFPTFTLCQGALFVGVYTEGN